MKNSKFLKLVPLQFFQKPFKRNEETEGNEIYYTPFTWRDFSECCKFLQMILNEETSTTLKTLENQQKHLLELFYFGCNSIFLNSDIYFQFSEKKLEGIIHNLRDQILRKPRILEEVLSILIEFLKEDSSKLSLETQLIMIELFCNWNYSDISFLGEWMQFSLVAFGLSPLIHLISLNSIPDNVKIELHLIIQNFQEKKNMILAFSSRKEAELEVSLITDLTDNEQDQIKLMGKLQMIGLQNANFCFELFSTVLTSSIIDKLLDILYFSKILKFDASSLINSFFPFFERWRDGIILSHLFEYIRVSILCTFSEIYLVPTSKNESVQSPPSSLIQPIFRISKFVDDTIPSEKCKTLCQILNMMTTSSEKDYSIDILIGSILPKILQRIIEGYSQQDREYILEKALSFSNQALHIYNPKQVLYEAVNHILDFFDKLPKDPHDATLLVELFNLGALVLKEDIGKLQGEKFFQYSFNNQSFSIKLEKILESDSFPQFFNRILPKLFSNIFSWNIPDKQKGWIILQTIQLGSQSIEEGMDRYKTFSVSFPLLFKKILNKDIFSVNQKLELFQSSFETLCQTQCMNLLLNQGIPFLLDVFMTFESFSLSMKRLTSLISSPSSSRIIENLQQISEFIKEHFGAENNSAVIQYLILKSKKNIIKLVNKVCRQELLYPIFKRIANYLFVLEHRDSFPGTTLFTPLCKIILLAMKLYSPLKISDTYSEIAQSMISNLDELINQQSLTKENLNESLEQFRCLVLHKNFFRTSLHSFRKKEEINLFKKELFSNIHKEIVTNDEAMDILENFGIRVEHMKEKYEEVATFSVNCIKNFFFNIELKPRKDLYSLLKERTSLLNQQIWSLPSNQQLKYHLFSAGYNLSYLDRDHYLRISITESIQEIEDYHRKVLLSFYTEYLQILRHVRLEKIPLSSEIIIPSYNLWTSDLSLLELKSRREKVVKLIQQVASSLNPPSKRIFHRLSALKEKEESLDNEIKLRKQKTQKQKQNFFQVVISHSFWNSLKYFNSTFSGCYAPDAEHDEKPIEIGLKATSAFISILEPKDFQEIENLELLYTDQGSFIFKLYSSGHSYNTFGIWLKTFEYMIDNNFVPAIIVPQGHPNPYIFNLLKNLIPTEYTGTLLSFKDDFFSKPSYYDHKIEKIHLGNIVITKQNYHLLQIPSLERISIQILNENEKERSKLQEFQNLYVKPRTQQKDLAGVLVAEIIQELQEEDSLQANAFGRFISSYVTKILEKGECDSETLELGFNLERWNKKNKHQAITEEKKNQQIEKIKELVWIKLEKLYHINPEELLMSNLKHFFELKNHVQFIVQNYNKDIWIYYDKCNELWKHIKQVLLSKQKLILLSDLKLVDQEAIMKQIFFNEGEVWRERGTRGMEKLEDFLKFISPKHSLCSRSPFGGIILKLDLETLPNNQTVFDYPFVGYCIGQWTNEYTYEIVTVFVDERLKSLDNAILMYQVMLEKLQKLGCRFLIYDILQGTIEKIANKSPIFQVLNRNARFWILMKQEPSYVVHINENKTEQFERFVINIRWLRICTAVFFFFMKLRNFLSRFSFLFWGNVSYLWKFVTSFFSYFFNQSKGKLIKGKH